MIPLGSRRPVVAAAGPRLAFAAALLLAAPLHAQPPSHGTPTLQWGAGPSWHPVNVWRQTEGLPQNTIITVRQGSDGYIWIGTKGGLTRFDGVRFATFKERALSEMEVWETAEGPDGSVWVATYGAGLIRLRDGAITAYRTADGLGSDFVGAVCVDAAGDVWAGTDKGAANVRVKDGTIRNYTVKDGLLNNLVSGLLCEPDGRVWLGTSGGGLHLFKDGALGPDSMTPADPGSITHIIRTPDSALWVGTIDAVLRWKDDVWQRFGDKDGLPITRGMRLHADATGNVWVGTHVGLYSFHEGRFVRHEILADLTQKQSIRAIETDHEGSLWVGHAALGLVRLRRGYFASYSVPHGLAGSSVRTLAEDSKGRLWIGTSEGLNRVVDGRLQLIVGRDGKTWPISSATEDPQGRIWFGTPDGVFRFTPRDCRSARCPEDVTAMPSGPITRINARVAYTDRHGDVWVGTDQSGLLRYSGGGVTAYTTKDGLADNGIRGLAEDREGRLWIGTKEGGVSILEHGRFRSVTEKDGLAGNMVQTLYPSRDGSLWIATRQGLTRFKDGRYVNYLAANGLYGDHIYGLTEDAAGDLWMGCSRGVFRVRHSELDAFAAGTAKTITSEGFGVEHGLRTTELAVGYFPTLVRAKDDRIWLATTDGVSVVFPPDLTRNSTAPKVHLDEVKIDGRSFDAARAAEAAPGNGDITFRYTALSFIEPLKVRFKIRLDPYDQDWVDAGSQRLKEYTNIPPGRYRFRVMAANSDGVWSQGEAGADLYLAPHFYQTPWFAGLLVLAVVLAVVGTHRWRVRSLQAREHELSERVQQAMAQIKTLRGLLPICASCKKIRDDRGYWNQMETYIGAHSLAEFSHGICPDCMDRLYPDYKPRPETEATKP